MSIGDELTKLGELHQRGQLSDDEFARAKARVLGGAGPEPGASLNALRRSRDERWLGGVCAGLAQVSGIAAWLWRLGFALLALCGGTGVLLYLLLWILVPQQDPPPVDDRHAQPLHPG